MLATGPTVATRFERLQREIDRLRGRVADAWSGDADIVHEQLRAANAQVQRRIRQIRDGVDVARDVTAVLGAVDDVIALLVGLGVRRAPDADDAG